VITDDEVSSRGRALGRTIEPLAAQVYFSPECHRAYEALGFRASAVEVAGVAMPDRPAYFCSRGSVMGQVPGELIAAAFAVFNPAVVVPSVQLGWSFTDAATICAARTEGAIRQLRRVLGEQPAGLERATALLVRATDGLRLEGRPLFAGLRGLGLPDDPVGAMWRLADQLREYRGDVHIASWTSAGFDATEIGLLTELYWGLPMRTHVRTRAWTDAELDAADARLVERGLVADGAFTDEGRAARQAVERATDRQCRPIVEALGDDFDELVTMLSAWSASLVAAGAFPAAGPQDFAGPAASRGR
jgi:hypothetical protein